VVAYFNARIGERNKLIDRLLQLTHDRLAAAHGWDIEIVSMVNWFNLKKGYDQAMLSAMQGYGYDDISNLNWALRGLAISAGHHAPYITKGLLDLYTRTENEEANAWLNYILYRSTGEKSYEEAFVNRMDEILASDDEDLNYELTRFCNEIWKYSSHSELLMMRPFLKKMVESRNEDLRREAIKLVAAKELVL
jgi:hypothetical protein